MNRPLRLAALGLSVACGSCALLDDYDWDRYASAPEPPGAPDASTSGCTLRIYSAPAVSSPELQWGETTVALADGVATLPSCPAHLSLRYASEPTPGAGQVFDFPALAVPRTSGVLLLDDRGATFVCTSNPTGETLLSLKILGSGNASELAGAAPRWEPDEWLCWVGLPGGTYSKILALTGAGQPVSIDLL